MLTDDYCNFETAKLLKEKGFNVPLCCIYDIDGLFVDDHAEFSNSTDAPGFECVAPTLQMALKWLRETHKLFIEVHVIDSNTLYMDNKYYFYRLYKDRRPLKLVEKTFMTYEEACEAAIKYCLTNLI